MYLFRGSTSTLAVVVMMEVTSTNDGGDGDKFVIVHDGENADRWVSPSLGGVLVIPLKDLMWATAILEDVLSMKVVRIFSISHLPLYLLVK